MQFSHGSLRWFAAQWIIYSKILYRMFGVVLFYMDILRAMKTSLIWFFHICDFINGKRFKITNYSLNILYHSWKYKRNRNVWTLNEIDCLMRKKNVSIKQGSTLNIQTACFLENDMLWKVHIFNGIIWRICFMGMYFYHYFMLLWNFIIIVDRCVYNINFILRISFRSSHFE